MNLDSNVHFAHELKDALNDTLSLTVNLEEFHTKAFKSKISGESRRNINKIYREVEQFREILEEQHIIKPHDVGKKVPKIIQFPADEEIKYPSLPKLYGKGALRETLRDSTSRLNLWKIGKLGQLTERNRSVSPMLRMQSSTPTPDKGFKKIRKTGLALTERQQITLNHIESVEKDIKEFKKTLKGLTVFCETNPGVPWNKDKTVLKKLIEHPEERIPILKKYNEKFSSEIKARGISTASLLKRKISSGAGKSKDEGKSEKTTITRTIMAFFTDLEKPPNYDMGEDPKQVLNRCVYRFKQAQSEQDKKLIDTLNSKNKTPISNRSPMRN